MADSQPMRQHRIHAACYDLITAPLEREILAPRQTALLTDLSGRVLDVGAGTGANIPYLRTAAHVVAVEPDPAMRRKLARRVAHTPVPVDLSDAAAESLPFPDDHFDAVVFTLVLCTVANPSRALAEARRVLKPGGNLVVLEHVRGTGRLARWQDLITPVWRRLVAGCHPNRDTGAAVQQAGFHWTSIEAFQPIPAWIPASPMLQGLAVSDRAG
jgi:ubiquinone/menaquinone biosynthesis C-methylase UbiE